MSTEWKIEAAPTTWQPKSTRYKLVVLAVIAGTLFVMGGLAWLAKDHLKHAALMLSTRVEKPEALSDKARRFLEEDVLRDGESLVWYFTTALTDIREDGNLLTDQRVVSYWTDEDSSEFWVDWVELEELGALRADFENSSWEYTTLAVWGRPEEPLFEPTSRENAPDVESPVILYLSGEIDRDHRFVEDLVERAREAGAEILSVEFGGDVSAAELSALEGAAFWSGDDIELAPAALLGLDPETDPRER